MISCEFCGHETEYLSVGRAARLLGVSVKTIRARIKRGYFPGTLKAEGVSSPFMYKIPVSAILPLLEEKAEANV